MIFNILIQIGLMKMASINSSDSFELKGEDHAVTKYDNHYTWRSL